MERLEQLEQLERFEQLEQLARLERLEQLYRTVGNGVLKRNTGSGAYCENWWNTDSSVILVNEDYCLCSTLYLGSDHAIGIRAVRKAVQNAHFFSRLISPPRFSAPRRASLDNVRAEERGDAAVALAVMVRCLVEHRATSAMASEPLGQDMMPGVTPTSKRSQAPHCRTLCCLDRLSHVNGAYSVKGLRLKCNGIMIYIYTYNYIYIIWYNMYNLAL